MPPVAGERNRPRRPSKLPHPWPPAPDVVSALAPTTPSACEPHRPWIESQVQLGRNAQSIYQDLVKEHCFEHTGTTR